MPPEEYLLFLRSLGWLAALTLATLVSSLPGPLGQRHSAWLVAFCALEALIETQSLLLPQLGIAWRLPLAIAAGMLLWEFARRHWNETGRRRLPGALHLLPVEMLALVAVIRIAAGDAGWPAWFAPLGALASILPALLGASAAVMLWRCLAVEADARRRAALRHAVLSLGVCAAFAALPDLPAVGVLAPWSAVAGLGTATFALAPARSRGAIAFATGFVLIAVLTPFAIEASGRQAEASGRTGLIARAQLAASRVAAPATAATEFERLRRNDTWLRDAWLWRLDEKFVITTLPARPARPVTAAEEAGVLTTRSFLTTGRDDDQQRTVTVHAPLRTSTFDTPSAWLALEYPEALWAAPRENSRRAALALTGAFALFCAMGFAVACRQAIEGEQRVQLERTQATSRAKTEFLAFLSHEMRTPLQTILGRAELLRREAPAATRHADAIETQGAHLLRLVNDLLDLGTIEAGKLKLQPAPFALRPLLASLEEIHGPPAAAKGLALDAVIAPGVPDALLGDEARLRQILGNLLGNAVKYTARGTIRLEVTASENRSGSQLLNFTVTDTGPGLPPEKISQLFTLFTRLDAGDTFTREGTGVGLALVRRLCDLMGGTVAVANRPEGGAVFAVQLRFPVVEASPAPDIAAPATTETIRALRVLVAEDNAAAREFLAEALAALGHHVTSAADGEAVLTACAAQAFDAVILDINLPGRDGIALARILNSRTPRPRLVACSAEAGAATRDAALAAGMDVFLEKPTSITALTAALTPVAPASAAASLFERLRSPEHAARARAALERELPAANARFQAAHRAGDLAELQRHAHHLCATALLADDKALAKLCEGLERAAAAGSAEECGAVLAALTRHRDAPTAVS